VKTKLIEATSYTVGPDGKKSFFNHGKFMLQRFEAEEWARKSIIDERAGVDTLLVGRCGWSPDHILVWDIQTGEGAIFRPGGLASYDLDKHRVWCCPLFLPFLEWLYKQDLSDIASLPDFIEIDVKDAPFALAGYRRPGPAAQAADPDDSEQGARRRAPDRGQRRKAPNGSQRGSSRRQDRT